MKFTKMQAFGNDYVYIDAIHQNITNLPELARFVSDRHFGIGSDGLILIAPSKTADCRMIMYNADGSEGAMCGNGIRCVAKYAYEHGIVHSDEITIETKSGIKALKLTVENGLVTYITVNMGQAVLEPAKIPVSADGDTFVARKLVVDGKEYEATCVSMGNPHCVIFTEGIDDLDLEKIGPSFENHELFPDRINTEFVEVIDDHTIKMRVWERGSGETWACGTGTCATVAALTELGICPAGQDIHVQLRGGELVIRVLPGRQLLMTGSAVTVYEGVAEV